MGADVVLLETPFLSQTGREEVRLYVQSKYNLALVALGSYLRAHSRATVRIVNMVKDRIDLDALVADLRRDPPKVLGVPLYSYNLSYTFRVMTRIKRDVPGVHVCVGGPHPAIFPRETLGLAPVDSMVLGDGEAVPPRRGVRDRGRVRRARSPEWALTRSATSAPKRSPRTSTRTSTTS
jgi:hypothetical protein